MPTAMRSMKAALFMVPFAIPVSAFSTSHQLRVSMVTRSEHIFVSLWSLNATLFSVTSIITVSSVPTFPQLRLSELNRPEQLFSAIYSAQVRIPRRLLDCTSSILWRYSWSLEPGACSCCGPDLHCPQAPKIVTGSQRHYRELATCLLFHARNRLNWRNWSRCYRVRRYRFPRRTSILRRKHYGGNKIRRTGELRFFVRDVLSERPFVRRLRSWRTVRNLVGQRPWNGGSLDEPSQFV